MPIHPILRLARQSTVSSKTKSLTLLPSRLLSSSRSQSARPTGKAGVKAGQTEKSSINASGSSSNSSNSNRAALPSKSSLSSAQSTSEKKVTLDSAALRSYAASPRGKPSSPPPANVKLTDKRNTQTQKETVEGKVNGEVREADKIAEERSQTGANEEQIEGDVQKMLKGASMHPAAVEQSRQADLAAAEASSSSLESDSVVGEASTSVGENSKNKVTEGIIIPAQRASSDYVSSSSTPASSTDTSRISSLGEGDGSSSGGDGIVDPRGLQDTADGEDDSSGPPTMTQPPELGNTRARNPLHPFDTHVFVKRLQSADFVVKRIDTAKAGAAGPIETTSLSSVKRHDPAEAIMEATRHLLVSRGERVLDHHISKTEVENQAYLFTAALSELRTELQVRARNDAAALRSMVTLLQREVDGLNQKMREDVAGMKHDIQVDMNNRKGEAKEEQNTLEQEIQDLNNRFTISISDLK